MLSPPESARRICARISESCFTSNLREGHHHHAIDGDAVGADLEANTGSIDVEASEQLSRLHTDDRLKPQPLRIVTTIGVERRLHQHPDGDVDAAGSELGPDGGVLMYDSRLTDAP